MSFYFAGLDWDLEDFIIGAAMSVPGVAPWTIPYYTRSGNYPSLQEAIIGLYSSLAWGALSRGGSLFINAQASKLLLKSVPVLAAVEAGYQSGRITADLIESVARGTQTSSGRHPKPSWLPMPIYHMLTS